MNSALLSHSPYWIGTAGWAYADWIGRFYPETLGGEHFLSYYQSFFSIVEVDATFYHLIPAKNAIRWCRNTPVHRHFLFTLKLWRGLTHERPEVLPKEPVRNIRAMCDTLQEEKRLGALLIQFPWSFRYCQENMGYLKKLLSAFAGFPVAVEVRHSTWLRMDFLHFLREHRAAFCNIDQPQLRQCLAPTAICTTDFAYLRLHGRNAANWFSESKHPYERYDYLYDTTELDELAALAKALADQTGQVIIIGNNHYRSQAAANALQIRARLEGPLPPVPSSLKAAYPALFQNYPVAMESMGCFTEGEQTDLFGG